MENFRSTDPRVIMFLYHSSSNLSFEFLCWSTVLGHSKDIQYHARNLYLRKQFEVRK